MFNEPDILHLDRTDMKRFALYFAVGVAALALGILLNVLIAPQPRQLAQPPTDLLQRGTALSGQERPVAEFALTDAQGAPFGNAELRGQWTYIFFGYTQCPDICPVTLQVMAEALRELERRQADREVQAVFVSVDPARDDNVKLKAYVEYFHPRMRGVSGDPEMLLRLTRPLGIIYNRTETPKDPDSYLVDHSAQVLVINPRGELAAVLPPPHDARLMAEDLLRLRDYFGKQSS
ncbi:MAG: SCO family protein [Thiotrichales bacterium]